MAENRDAPPPGPLTPPRAPPAPAAAELESPSQPGAIVHGLAPVAPSPAQFHPPLVHKKKTSAFRGVSRRKHGWEVCVLRHGKYNYLGKYKEERAAARAYDMVVIKIDGAEARTNFPPSKYVAAMKRLCADELSVEDFITEMKKKAKVNYSRSWNWRFDERAVTHMKEVFQKTQKPSKDEKLKIAEMFALTKKQVGCWFASERYRMKAKESN